MSERLFADLLKIEERHGLSPALVLRKLGEAAADYFHKNGTFGFPVSIEPAATAGLAEQVRSLARELKELQLKKVAGQPEALTDTAQREARGLRESSKRRSA